jgi:hypothetical protein
MIEYLRMNRNGATGSRDMAGKAATGSGRAERERARYNGASGMSDIEGSEPDWQLAARVAASECGAASEFQRRSMKEKNLLRVES